MALSTPEAPINRADFLSERNRMQLEKWNSALLDRVDRTIHEIIAQMVEKGPTEQAVYAWDGIFTYAELSRHACQLAQYLIKHGVGPEVIVPLCFEKSKWNVVAMLGVLMAGGACKCSFSFRQWGTAFVHPFGDVALRFQLFSAWILNPRTDFHSPST